MKIIIPTIGTRGDVQPYIAPALGLLKAGHTWPSLPSKIQASGPRAKNLDTTRMIVHFFFP